MSAMLQADLNCALDRIATLERERDEARAERDAAFAMTKCECAAEEACREIARARAERDALAAALRDIVDLVEEAIVIDTDPITGEQGYRTKWDSDAAYAVAAGSAALAKLRGEG